MFDRVLNTPLSILFMYKIQETKQNSILQCILRNGNKNETLSCKGRLIITDSRLPKKETWGTHDNTLKICLKK